MRQEALFFGGGSGIDWTICKQSAPHSKHIPTPTTPHHSIFTDWMLFLTLMTSQQKDAWVLKEHIFRHYQK